MLTICLKKSSSVESRSAESLLKEHTSLFSTEWSPAPCFFRALKEWVSELMFPGNLEKVGKATGNTDKDEREFTLWDGRDRSRAQWGMSKSWCRWGGAGRCSQNGPKHPTMLYTLMTSSLALEGRWPAAQSLTHNFHLVGKPPKKCPVKRKLIVSTLLFPECGRYVDF